MKKLMIIAALMLAAIAPMKGQEWIYKIQKADDLLGTNSDSVAIYMTEKYSVIVSFTNDEIWIKSHDGVFDYHKNEYYILVGMYDKEDNLLSKDRVFCYYPNTKNHTLINICNSKHLIRKDHPNDTIATRFIDYLNNGDGYIRIVASMYLDDNLTIKIPCFNSK